MQLSHINLFWLICLRGDWLSVELKMKYWLKNFNFTFISAQLFLARVFFSFFFFENQWSVKLFDWLNWIFREIGWFEYLGKEVARVIFISSRDFPLWFPVILLLIRVLININNTKMLLKLQWTLILNCLLSLYFISLNFRYWSPRVTWTIVTSSLPVQCHVINSPTWRRVISQQVVRWCCHVLPSDQIGVTVKF